MWFWWFMMVFDVMIPLVMVIGGRVMWKHCPKEINGVFGYRTKRSTRNKDTWRFAHDYCGRLWWKIGWVTLVGSLIGQLPTFGMNEQTVGIVGTVLVTVQTIVLIASIFPTERALKRTFTEDGRRKPKA